MRLEAFLFFVLTTCACFVDAEALFKPHYPNAGIRWGWGVDSASNYCSPGLEFRQSVIIKKKLAGRSHGIKTAWVGMYEDMIRRSSRVGDAEATIAFTIHPTGKVDEYTIVKSTTQDSSLLRDIRKRISSTRFRRLRNQQCIRLVVNYTFALDLYAE